MNRLLVITLAASFLISGCSATKATQSLNPASSKPGQQTTSQVAKQVAPNDPTQSSSANTQSESTNSQGKNNSQSQPTISPPKATTDIKTKSINSTPAPSASLNALFISPKPYAWVPNKPLTVSWTVKNTTRKDVAFNLSLTDLTDSRITYQTDLDLNPNFPSTQFKNGVYSWTIPATYINSQGYTLQDKLQYKLTLFTYVKWDKQGVCPYKPVHSFAQFSVDDSKANFEAPVGKLGVSLSFQQSDPTEGRNFHFEVIVTSGGKPLPDAAVSVMMHSATQTYTQNLVTQINGTADFWAGIFDTNPITANVTVKGIGQVATASGTYKVTEVSHPICNGLNASSMNRCPFSIVV